MFGYRTGAKQNHINQIRERVANGESAEQISNALMIELSCVKSFVAHFKKQNSPKQEQDVDTPKGERPEDLEAEPESQTGRRRGRRPTQTK